MYRKCGNVGFQTSRTKCSNFVNKVTHTFSSQSTQADTPLQMGTQRTDGENAVDPLNHPNFFGVEKLVTMKQLFDARVHLGHKSGVRNIYMRPYIFGTRIGMDVIDLDQTYQLLMEALNITAHIAYRNGVILFLSRHLQTIPYVEQAAVNCGEYAHCRNWKEGLFTNASMEHDNQTRLPDLSIFISTHDSVFQEHTAVTEMAKCNIPTIGIVDTSCDPRLITYPVPGNDDTPCAVQLYCNLFKEAILLGKNKRKEIDSKVTEDYHSDENKMAEKLIK